MKTRIILLATAIIALSFVSCSNDDNKNSNYDGPVLFHSTIKTVDGDVTTKATNSSWGSADAIGIFMKTGAGLTTIVDNAENKKYTTTGDGKFIPANKTTDAIYFPENGNPVAFIAYYPYITPLTTNIYKVDVTNQASQEAIDLLYSDDATEKTASSTVAMGFTHKLTKLVLDIKADSNIPSLNGLSVVLNGANTKADFDLATGVLGAGSAPAAITAKSTVTGATATAEAIVLPWAAIADRTIVFTLPSGSFKWDVPAVNAYEEGKKYTIGILLKDGGKVEITATATITDWGVGGNENIELEAEAGSNDGTQTKPYTVTEALTKVGETGKWATGFIVGSTAKTKGFGPEVNTNILLAASATENNEAKCIIVNLDGSAVQANLDIVANPALKGTKVKVLGDIVNNIFGGTTSITIVTAQEGGVNIGTPETKEFFNETFGTAAKVGTFWPKIGVYDGFDMKAPVVYYDQYVNGDVRSTSTISTSVWLPKDKDSELVISGFESGYQDVILSLDIATNVVSTNANIVQILCNDVALPAASQPNHIFDTTGKFQTFTVSIPNGTTKITFNAPASTNNAGIRIDNVILKGTK